MFGVYLEQIPGISCEQNPEKIPGKKRANEMFHLSKIFGYHEKESVPFGHDSRVIVGVDEICMVGKPTHAEDGDHAAKHLHNLNKMY